MRKFSVAVNAYNREKYIERTLRGIIEQSLKPAEIIVLDDGSTDSTAGVVSTFAPKVRLIRSSNEGPGLSRHRAVESCQHEWIATCDSDDVWRPNHLETLDRALTAYPSAVMACTNSTRFCNDVEDGYDHFDAIGSAWWRKASAANCGTVQILSGEPYLHLLEANPVYVSCQAFSASAYAAIGPPHADFSRMNSEDSDVTRRFALHGTLVADCSVTVAIRKHAENFSISGSANLIGKARILQRHLDANIVSDDWRDTIYAEHQRVLLQAFRHAYWENDYPRAKEALKLRGSISLGWRDRLRRLKLDIMK